MMRTQHEEQYDINATMAMKHWQRRSVSSLSFFEDEASLLQSSQALDIENRKGKFDTTSHLPKPDEEVPKVTANQTLPGNEAEICIPSITTLKASDLGDFPARYEVYSLRKHQFPVIGVYIDPRVLPGFKYRVQRIDKLNQNRRNESYLFHGKSLVLRNIGRGYARRFTFENTTNSLEEENYFYSDNNQEGYAFEIQTICDGDKFTIHNANHEPQGIVEVIKVDKKQLEISSICENKRIEKRVRVKCIAKVEFYDSGLSQQVHLSGIVLCHRSKNEKVSKIVKIVDINIRNRRYYLVPGYEETSRRIHVKGDNIGDVPTAYTITGLLPYEMPAIGTYVDPRILPGFQYKIRPSNRQRHLFQGKALRLTSISAGYAKKLTFESDSAVNPDNYLWSDNHQDGLAFETRAVNEKMKFSIMAGDKILGEAQVFRTDLPQIEQRQEKIKTTNGHCYVKYVHVDVMCHIKMDINESGVYHNENLMRVYGLAVVRKDPNQKQAYLERIEHIGLDSQLNVILANADIDITFLPRN